MHKELYSVDHLFRLACKAEQVIKRRTHKTTKCKKMVIFSASPAMIMETTSPEADLQDNSEGTELVHACEIDQCSINLPTPCVELANDLVTSLDVDKCVVDLVLSRDETIVTPTILSASIATVHSSIDLSAQTENIADENEPCDMPINSDLDHIKLIRHDEVLVQSFYDTCLWYITFDSPISLSHARAKIAEITCVKSVYAPNFQFNLIGD